VVARCKCGRREIEPDSLVAGLAGKDAKRKSDVVQMNDIVFWLNDDSVKQRKNNYDHRKY
jgi:hypothetical protein